MQAGRVDLEKGGAEALSPELVEALHARPASGRRGGRGGGSEGARMHLKLRAQDRVRKRQGD